MASTATGRLRFSGALFFCGVQLDRGLVLPLFESPGTSGPLRHIVSRSESASGRVKRRMDPCGQGDSSSRGRYAIERESFRPLLFPNFQGAEHDPFSRSAETRSAALVEVR